jgi:plastocyanin
MSAARITYRIRIAATAALATLALAACGEAAGEDIPNDEASAARTIEVVGVDYGFEGVPDAVSTGTELTFRNDSDVEAHEMVVLRINDREGRPLEELIAAAATGGAEETATFVGGFYALPEEDGAPLGPPGPLVLTEAGRYALICNFPVGADPQAVAEAFSEELDGPPNLGEGAPHFVEGMVAELTVR